MYRIFCNLLTILLLALPACAPVKPEHNPNETRSRMIERPVMTPALPDVPYLVQNPEVQAPSAGGREIRVALLTPLTGDSSKLGQGLLDAGMLALFDKYGLSPQSQNVQLVILPKDTRNSPKATAEATEEAIKEGAKLIIGPLFSDTVRAAGPVAAKQQVQVLSFSNNTKIAGKNVFILGFLPDQQTERVLKHAFEAGYSRIGVLAPADEYGTVVVETAQRMALLHNKVIASVATYPPGTDKFELEIENLLGGRPNQKQREIDAILIAEGGDRLKKIATQLKAFGISPRKVKMLGTGLWDDESLIGYGDLAFGWFASSPARSYAGFEQRFITQYGYKPPRLASLAYDAVALAATLAQNPGGADFSTATLTQEAGFNGPANGIFRLMKNGATERGLAVLEINEKSFKEVSPAPRSFDQ